MPKEKLPLAEIGLVVLAGRERKPSLLLDDGIGITVPLPGMPGCSLIMMNERGIVRIHIMRADVAIPYHR
jgi:hypothetical protein